MGVFLRNIFSSMIMPTCSHTWASGEERSLTKCGTAPASTTNLVCSDDPEAMLVRAHAA